MDCHIFVVVRTDSQRLPNKALLRIKNKPLVKILIDRIKSVGNSNVIVCTTKSKADDKLANFLEKNKIIVYRGNKKDILKRLYLASKKFKINKFVVVEGDDIFCDPDIINETCKRLNRTTKDFLVWEKLPFGTSPVGIKADKLAKLVKLKSTNNTETGWIKFIIQSGLFKVQKLVPENRKLARPEIRLSIDYMEDFILAKKLYQMLPSRFSLFNIIDTFNQNPHLLKINEFVKERYLENFKKKQVMRNEK